ncbi:MAG TPA: hypothetical protein VJ045_08410 [Hyphomicrobiaceae bacterium]|nr:hypothetical protein [Hyphomicrobiaceae bacterium]HLB07403.1 hypothetical protein [Alphaproteobacteria bacterium]
MRIVNVETAVPCQSFISLPIRLEQRASRTSLILMLSVLVPAGLMLLMPFLLVIEHLAQDQALRALIAERPAGAAQLLLALAFWGVLFAWPLVRISKALARERSIEVDRGGVTVTERGLFAERVWNEPLDAYAGLVHHVRASLSGTRHELVLVHDNRERSVLLAVSDRLARPEVDSVASLLGVAEIPSRDVFSLASIGGTLGPAEPTPRLGGLRA